MSYQVDTPVFSGPFELLLHLITKRQVEIYEVSLAEIVDAYISELEKMEELDLEIATEFLLIAATLIELKSARLLPGESDSDLDDELTLFERRDLLIARLLDAKTFSDASKVVQLHLADGGRYSPRVAGIEEPFLHLCPDLSEQVSPERFAEIALIALTETELPTVDISHIHQISITVGEVMHSMADVLEARRRATFRELTVNCANRIEVAVHFLAMLELFKQNTIDIEQFTTFGEITVIWAPVEQILDWDGAGAEWDEEAPPIESELEDESETDAVGAEMAAGHAGENRQSDDESDAGFAARVAEELEIDLEAEADEPADYDLLDRKLLDNTDLIEEAADLLKKPPRRNSGNGHGATER